MRHLLLPFLLLGCTTHPVGDFRVQLDKRAGTLDIAHSSLPGKLEGLRMVAGVADAELEMRFGSFRVEEHSHQRFPGARLTRVRGDDRQLMVEVEDEQGVPMGLVVLQPIDERTLAIELQLFGVANRLGFEAACDEQDHFLGLGSHAMDVDHVGHAFPLWVSEPGIGKVDTNESPPDWHITGTRHASSFPVPFLLRPQQPHGLLLDTTARIDLDLCASSPDRFSAVAWQSQPLRVVLQAGPAPLEVVRDTTRFTGRLDLPPPWVFAPWNDAIRGSDRVREVAARLREFGAPSTVIWTEDWKGGKDTVYGYHLTGEWFLDTTLYPDAHELAAELADEGFQWFAYFSPFVTTNTVTWDEAEAAGALIQDASGEPYRFMGPSLEPTSMVDLSGSAGRAFVRERMEAALDIGFTGWMADYAEWLPPDTVISSGDDPLQAHNAWPLMWQQLNAEVLEGHDASFFVRSGWAGTAGLVPVVWGGDQRTSFDTDDGLPTIVARGLGMAASGVPVFTHDIAGYQSVGNPPSTKELWFRWAALGAFSPVMRTHHGAYDLDNHQFDTDDETTAFWAEMAREHMRLFPYRYGLAHRAATDGTPMILPVGFVHPGEPWGRKDVWMLGEALLVAPVLEAGVEGREVALPGGTTWYDWSTHARASSGWAEAPLDHIPVFAAAGTTVPTFADAPDTLLPDVREGLATLADVDGARVVYLFGGGGPFTEADGTSYSPEGSPSGSGEATETLRSGTIEVAGVRLAVDGPVERTYRVVVVD